MSSSTWPAGNTSGHPRSGLEIPHGSPSASRNGLGGGQPRASDPATRAASCSRRQDEPDLSVKPTTGVSLYIATHIISKGIRGGNIIKLTFA